MTVEQAVNNIQHAVYGEEVRGSIAEALLTMNNKGEQDKEDAEAWAVGQRGGVNVGNSDETYHNNSKYYSQQANSSMTTATAAAATATTAQNNAISAKDSAIIAKNEAVSARNDAVAARNDILGLASMLEFHNIVVPANAWVSSSTYAGFNYSASLNLTGVLSSHIPEVILDPAQATSGNYAPVATSGTDEVVIYARTQPSAAITIPTIICKRLVS